MQLAELAGYLWIGALAAVLFGRAAEPDTAQGAGRTMMFQVYLWIVPAPPLGALAAGPFGRVADPETARGQGGR